MKYVKYIFFKSGLNEKFLGLDTFK